MSTERTKSDLHFWQSPTVVIGCPSMVCTGGSNSVLVHIREQGGVGPSLCKYIQDLEDDGLPGFNNSIYFTSSVHPVQRYWYIFHQKFFSLSFFLVKKQIDFATKSWTLEMFMFHYSILLTSMQRTSNGGIYIITPGWSETKGDNNIQFSFFWSMAATEKFRKFFNM